jgi:hypothetical protein
MSDPTAPPRPPALQFERAESVDAATTTGVMCSQCKRLITDSYYNLAQSPYCASCKSALEETVAATRTPGVFGKALAFGLGAAIAGAVVYYAVIALFELEIGIVAILIGYMVGYAVRKASRGVGARRYQILAAALTYFAVGLAYLPIAMKDSSSGSSKVTADSTADAKADSATNAVAPATDSTSTPGVQASDGTETRKPMSIIVGIAILFGLALALPVMIIVGSMPSGLISALIIGFGVMRAWQMTAAPNLAFAGPLKVAPPSAPSDPTLAHS